MKTDGECQYCPVKLPPERSGCLALTKSFAVLVEVNADWSGILAPRSLIVIPEARAPPVLLFVLQEVGARRLLLGKTLCVSAKYGQLVGVYAKEPLFTAG